MDNLINIIKQKLQLVINQDNFIPLHILIFEEGNEQKYNMMIKKEYIKGLRYYIKIVPNILILILPVFVLDILLKMRSR
jgi:hypothetical protein